MSNCAFSWLDSLVEQRTDKSLGGSGEDTLENFFSTDLHELEKQSKTKVGEATFPLAPLAAPLRDSEHSNNCCDKFVYFAVITIK